MNERTEAELVESAAAAARDSRWTKRWALAALGVLATLAPGMWFLAQSAAAAEVAPVRERLTHAEAQIEAVKASADSTAIASEAIAADVQSMRIMFESRVAPLETRQQIREGRRSNGH